jgi:hypothetical protein
MRFEIPDEVVAALADAIAARLPRAAAPASTTAPRFITRAEAVALGVELKALHRAEKTGELAAFKPGRAVVYRAADVVALVERARVAAPAVASSEAANVIALDPFERARAARFMRDKQSPSGF